VEVDATSFPNDLNRPKLWRSNAYTDAGALSFHIFADPEAINGVKKMDRSQQFSLHCKITVSRQCKLSQERTWLEVLLEGGDFVAAF
jgi:hypothetical protein